MQIHVISVKQGKKWIIRVKEPLGPRAVSSGVTNSMRDAEMVSFEFQERHMGHPGKKRKSCAEEEIRRLTSELTSDIQF